MAASASLYLGLISGTSADGIDVALARFAPRFELLGAQSFAYPSALRERVLHAAEPARPLDLDDYGSLDVEIGAAFAAAALALLDAHGVAPEEVAAIGSHGQTVRHRPAGAAPFSLQIGDPSVIAERSGILTVADFRRADLAAGGQGAPLLPALHAALFADPQIPRAVLNLGGIANVSLLIPGRAVLGFDTGPANCLLDAWTTRHLGAARDEGGAWASSGRVAPDLLEALLADPFFAAPAPKSSGREYFQLAWLERRLVRELAPADVQATLLALSVRSIVAALEASGAAELYCCGGGAHNRALMAALTAALPGMRVTTTAALGLDPDFVEAVGFAWLAQARLSGQAGNLPSVTGARGPRLLGAIYAAPPMPRSR